MKGARVVALFQWGRGHLKAKLPDWGEVQNLSGNQEVQWSPRFLQNWAQWGGLIAVTYLWPETAEANQTGNRHRRRCPNAEAWRRHAYAVTDGGDDVCQSDDECR